MVVTRLSGNTRRAAVILLHAALVVASFYASFAIRLDFDLELIDGKIFWQAIPVLLALRLGSLAYFRLFRGMWRYVAIPDVVQIVKATTVSTIAFVILQTWLFGLTGFPRSVFLIDFAGNIFLLVGVRLAVRVFRERSRPDPTRGAPSGRLLIIGAGDAGASLCAQALTTSSFHYVPVAFADDDRGKIGQTIQGVPVAGRISDIPSIVRRYVIELAVIAIPTTSPARKREIVEICRQGGVECKILPATSDLVDGTVGISEIREVDVVDLLGRPQAQLDMELISGSIRGKKILVTGAAGSVGSELTRQIAQLEPAHLVLVDRAENELVFLEAEIRALITNGTELTARIVDVNDAAGLLRLMRECYPDTVFHAAAHKHVHLMEDAPCQAIANNVGGTLTTARCAIEIGADNFVLVSTDKAVNPTSVMGATKRLAELGIRSLGAGSPTRLMAVRFGNVLGSNASVVPIFRRQIERGGPVTVTDPEVERYFMSASEAAGLILQAAAFGKGGEVFVLEMGDPIKIVTLAETLITLSGLTPGEDVEIVFTGLRGGEKLSEELNFSDESFRATGLDKLLVLDNGSVDGAILDAIDRLLADLPELGENAARNRLAELVPEYRPAAATRPSHGSNIPEQATRPVTEATDAPGD